MMRGQAAHTSVQRREACRGQSDNRDVSGSAFRFRLERVRALREHGEAVAQQELAGAMTRRGQCEDQLNDAEARLDLARTAQRETFAPTTAVDLQARQAYLERIEQARDATAADLDRHEAEVSERRDRLTEAARAREALDRLKERRRADFDLAAARQDGRELDEVALNVHRRGAA